MAFEFFDYDAFTGCTEYIAFDDGKVHIRSVQDVEPIRDFTKFLANTGTADSGKNDAKTYAILPIAVLHKIRNETGFNPLGSHGRDGTKFLLDQINQNYPDFKATTKRHALK